jgi:AcrR family transcriptional regulator
MDKREQILDAAERVLHAKGLSGTTTRAITTAAGCAEGTLYLYFTGRAELFLALFERQLGAAFAAPNLFDKNPSARPHAVLVEVGLQFLRFHRKIGPLLSALFAEPALLKSYRELLFARSPEAPRAAPALIAYLRGQQRAKRVSAAVDATVVAEALLGACFSRAFHDNMFAKAPTPAADRAFLRTLVRHLLGP